MTLQYAQLAFLMGLRHAGHLLGIAALIAAPQILLSGSWLARCLQMPSISYSARDPDRSRTLFDRCKICNWSKGVSLAWGITDRNQQRIPVISIADDWSYLQHYFSS